MITIVLAFAAGWILAKQPKWAEALISKAWAAILGRRQ